MRPRTYQLATVETIRAMFAEGRRSVLVVAPTGSGKSLMAHLLIRRVRAADWAQCFVVAHAVDLIDQPALDLDRDGLGYGWLKAGRPVDQTAAVQLGQVQSMVARPIAAAPRRDPGPDGEAVPHRRALVVWDEVHRLRAAQAESVRRRLLETFERVYFVGLTATPYRLDGRGLGEVFDVLVEATAPAELVAAGHILDPVVYSRPPRRQVEDDGESAGGGASAVTDVGDAALDLLQPGLVGDVVETWLRLGGGLPTICRGVNRAHARDLRRRFRELGAGELRAAGYPRDRVRAEYVGGDVPEAECARLYARLAVGGAASDHPWAVDVLCTGGTKLEEGWDSAKSYRHALADRSLWVPPGDGLATADGVPDAPAGGVPALDVVPPRYRPLGCLIDAAPTNSRGAWIQRVGRVTRPWTAADRDRLLEECGAESDLKARAVVLCHSGNLERHGFLVQHSGFALGADRVGAAPVRQSAYPQFRPPATRQCPACFASAPRGAACPGCGAEAPVADSLPEERPGELRQAVWDPTRPPPDSDEQKVEFIRAQWRAWCRARDQRAARGQPPYSPWWPAARYKAKYGAWPDQSLYRAVAREHGVHRLAK